MIGIYKITNPSGKIYIGQSININKRKTTYSKGLCKGQKKLFNSISKYGWINHKFEVLTECESNNLNNLERYYQDLYDSCSKNGLNLKLTNSSDRKCEVSEDTKLKISISNKIIHAKKKGTYDKNKDYSNYKPKAIKSKNVVFTPTGEKFRSIKEMYDKYKDHFYSYSALYYQLKKYGIIESYKLLNYKNEKTEDNSIVCPCCGGLGKL